MRTKSCLIRSLLSKPSKKPISQLADSITDDNFSGAIVKGANFKGVNGFTANQLYSTASYASGDLTGMTLANNTWNFSGLDFANKNLSGTTFNGGWGYGSTYIGNANFAGANLSNVNFEGTFPCRANFSGAIIKGADFGENGSLGLGNLYSTASYVNGDLAGINLSDNFLEHGDLANQNLAGAHFDRAELFGADFTNANLAGASFAHAQGDPPNANFTGADLRGAIEWLPGDDDITHNTIRPDGSIQELALLADEKLIVRNNPLAITVDNRANFNPTSTLRFLLDKNWTSPIGFGAGLHPALSGTLELEFAAGVDPASLIGRAFDLFDWTGVYPIGAFTVSSPYVWDISNLYSTGEVTLTAVPEPATVLLLALASSIYVNSRRTIALA
jgi:uncharacterized protein YjbI with pentapeptide repeats